MREHKKRILNDNFDTFRFEMTFPHAEASLSAESFIDSDNKMLSILRAHKFYIGTSVKFMPTLRMEMFLFHRFTIFPLPRVANYSK